MSQPDADNTDEFFHSLGDYVPTIPDELTAYYLKKTGFSCPDVKVKRLVSLAAQKFIAEIANDALQYCKIRQQGARGQRSQTKEKRLVLTMDDLAFSLKNYGVNVRKPPYFADNLTAGVSSGSGGRERAADKGAEKGEKGNAGASASSTTPGANA